MNRSWLVLACCLLVATPRLSTAALPAVRNAQGESIDLEKHFAGKRRVIVLAGLGTPAETELLELVQSHWKRLRKRHEGVLAVVFIGRTSRQAAELGKTQGYDFPWFCDPEGELVAPLEVDYLPTLLLANPAGEILYRATALPEALIESVMSHPGRVPRPEASPGR